MLKMALYAIIIIVILEYFISPVIVYGIPLEGEVIGAQLHVVDDVKSRAP